MTQFRLHKGLSQKQVAEQMNCTASKISKIEGGTDRSLKWLDMCQYMGALDMTVSVMATDNDLPAAESIKHSVFKIREDLLKLAKLTNDIDMENTEDGLTEKIHTFFGEVLMNFLAQYEAGCKELRPELTFSEFAMKALEAPSSVEAVDSSARSAQEKPKSVRPRVTAK